MKAVRFILMLLMTLQLNACKKAIGQLPLHDSIVTNISSQYEPRSFLHKMLMGKNYRDSWTMPVTLPVFHFGNSGFSIERLGGGQQSKSLHLLDKQGNHWLLRTVDKNVEGAIPKFLRDQPAEKAVQDLISASFPYSHIIAEQLAAAAGVPSSSVQVVFVADDEALKAYRSIFAGKVCTLEANDNERKTYNTEHVADKLIADNKNLLIQKQILKARLLDMLLGDWDRHNGQWEWKYVDSSNSRFFYVIPKDRDNALFYANGLIPDIAKNTFMRHVKGFKKNSTGLKQLNKKALGFDAFFLNELNANDWRQSILEFQQQLNDSVIVASIRKLPSNIYAEYGETMIKKLKSRRDGLLKNGMKYYNYLAGAVDVRGSDKEELFVVSGKENQMTVTVYRVENNSKQKIYVRTFDRSETKSVILNGLKGEDHFLIEDSAPTAIRLKIFGNEGKDTYVLKGKSRSKIIDHGVENKVVIN